MNCYHDETDDILVELTLLGNEKAYEELVLRHQNAVKGSAYKITGNRYSAEDASQDAFVSAWIHLNSLKDKRHFGAWVCSIAKNCARNLVVHYSSKASDISFSLLENIEETASDESGLSELLQAAALGEAERDEALHAAVEALSEKIREAITLHYFDGLSVSEIAKKLSLPVGTVKWRLSEGRKQLRKEYGVMEKAYDENETLVARVMRQVEELKLWRLKNDKTGFEEDYRRVLTSVEALDDSEEREYALADVLLRGYWWLPGAQNKEMLQRIKEAAEKSRNEEVMKSVMAYEHDALQGQECLDFMKGTQIPYLEALELRETQAYVWFWYGRNAFHLGRCEDAVEATKKVLTLVDPSDVYYASALSALRVYEKHGTYGDDWNRCGYSATGEVYRYIGGKLYFWTQPGFSVDTRLYEWGIAWNCGQCDGLIYDPGMKVGDRVTASDGKSTLTYLRDGVTVETPAGIFENCSVFVFHGERYGLTYSETAFCPGVGIVFQRLMRHGETDEWRLSSYTAKGGSGLFPLFPGNRWEYVCTPREGIRIEQENSLEVISFENGTAVVSSYAFARRIGYDRSTWKGNILEARREYCREDTESDGEMLVSVEDALLRAAALARTKREKRHTEIATDVMRRIFATDPEANPDYTENGHWNFFDYYKVVREGKTVSIPGHGNVYSFEWKDMRYAGDEGTKLLYNFLYDILDDMMGCIWSEDWIPGYHLARKTEYHGMPVDVTFEVLDDETVVTPAGTFENCRHVSFDAKGLKGGWSYRGGHKEYWFAPGIGIVRFRTLYKKNTLECVWKLTKFLGTGEGYFPVEDGLFRRYEPTEIGNGWHAAVEYTFDTDETGTVIFRNALGTQDRANYEWNRANAEAKKREKEQAKA